MFIVYLLYSGSASKTYVGMTGDLDRRLFEHNVSETKGFTLRYRPWTLIRKEEFFNKADAMKREKFLKTGRGREDVKGYVNEFLDGAVSAAAEKD